MVALCLVMLPRSTWVLGWNQTNANICMEFVYFLSVCMGSLWILLFPSTFLKNGCPIKLPVCV